MQARFCGAALQEKQQKPQCVWEHFAASTAVSSLEGPDRSTSKLTVSDWVLLLTPGLQLGARNHHGYKRGMADASTSRVRARQVVLRLSVREKVKDTTPVP